MKETVEHLIKSHPEQAQILCKQIHELSETLTEVLAQQQSPTETFYNEIQQYLQKLTATEHILTIHNLYEDFTNMIPFGYELANGGYREVKSWSQLYFEVCEFCIQQDERLFYSFVENPIFKGTKNKMFAFSAEELNRARAIGNIYMETKINSNYIRNNLRDLLLAYQLKIIDLKIYMTENH